MKKLILAALLTLSIMIGCSTAPSTKVANDWLDSVPGTIIISNTISDADFQAFYNQTLDPNRKSYRIILNTNGGEAMACVGIMSRIEELQSKGVHFTTEVYSKAYSAGAFIFMMGDTKIMHEASSLMWHTMVSQMLHTGKEYPGLPNTGRFSRKELFTGLDEYVFMKTRRKMDRVDPMTLETMLMHSGMTFILAEDAVTLGMVDEYVVFN